MQFSPSGSRPDAKRVHRLTKNGSSPTQHRYRLYVDESGDADLTSCQNDKHRYISLTGVIAKVDAMRDAITPSLNAIKADLLNADPDEQIVLHRKELMQKKPPFEALCDPAIETEFNTRLLEVLATAPYTVVTATLDKRQLVEKYSVWRRDPYHYCFEILVERYVLLLGDLRARGDVMVESRNAGPDARLKAAYAGLYKNGSRYVSSVQMQTRLMNGVLKVKEKRQNVTGLQMADLIAHPSAAYAKQIFAGGPEPAGFGAKVVSVLLEKYHSDDRGRIEGYGQKWLP